MRLRSRFATALVLFLTLVPQTHARLLHIIHTNDLHSYFQGPRAGGGGYARVKSKIDELKARSEAQGIDTLQLDGGDFGEGTSFFLADEGAASLRALGLLGTDVAVIGNHDHMMGGKILGEQIRRAQVKTQFLSANMITTPAMELGDLVKPYVDLERAGAKIRIIGLSTAEVHFQYTILPGLILPPVPVGAKLADQAKQEGREVVIALTHIGQQTDVKLARESRSIDLIVGGHSHDRIEQVRYEKNKNGRPVPIVQAGSHGLVVGSLLLDIADSGELNVVDYKLHEIQADLPVDPSMQTLVAEAEESRNAYFNGRWDEVIGFSEINLAGYFAGKNPRDPSCWGEHMARMTTLATGADVGVYLSTFAGEQIPAGPIRYGDMIDNFPHFRSYQDQGWEISTMQVNGTALKALLQAFTNVDDLLGINFYGITFRRLNIPRFVPYFGGRRLLFSIRINGKKLVKNQKYTVSFPTEVAYALRETLPAATRRLFPSLQETGQFYWDLTERYIREHSPLRCLYHTPRNLDIARQLQLED